MRNPGISAVLSFFVTGLGHIYIGEIAKGLALFLVQCVLGTLTIILSGWFFIPAICIWVFAIFDSYSTTQKKNHRLAIVAKHNKKLKS